MSSLQVSELSTFYPRMKGKKELFYRHQLVSSKSFVLVTFRAELRLNSKILSVGDATMLLGEKFPDKLESWIIPSR